MKIHEVPINSSWKFHLLQENLEDKEEEEENFDIGKNKFALWKCKILCNLILFMKNHVLQENYYNFLMMKKKTKFFNKILN
jgi:hypothetical protein